MRFSVIIAEIQVMKTVDPRRQFYDRLTNRDVVSLCGSIDSQPCGLWLSGRFYRYVEDQIRLVWIWYEFFGNNRVDAQQSYVTYPNGRSARSHARHQIFSELAVTFMLKQQSELEPQNRALRYRLCKKRSRWFLLAYFDFQARPFQRVLF